MKTKKGKNKISVEKALNALSLNSLNEHMLESAEKRVWNQISYSISQLEAEKEIEKTHQNSMPKQQVRIWQRSYVRFAMTFVLILLLVIGTSGLAWYVGFNLGQDNNNVAINDAKNTNEVNVRELAASRFTQLNGVTFEEFKAALDEIDTAPVSTPIAQIFVTPQSSQLIPNTKTDTKVDETKVIELAKKAEKTLPSIYYSKQELTFSKDFTTDMNVSTFGLGQGKIEKIDYSKPLTYETWITSNYSKTKVSQNDVIILEYVTTPEFGFSYVGGEYAVQAKYVNTKYTIAGLTNDGATIPNPEIELLKYILTSPGADKAKQVNENGQDLVVVDTDEAFGSFIVPINSTKIKTKFFLDKKTFNLVRTDQYVGNKLVLTNKNLSSQKIEETDLQSLFRVDTIGANITTKITNYDPTQDVQKVMNESSVKDFVQQYDLLYIKGKDNSDVKVLNYSSEEYLKLKEYQKLIQSKEFNPLFQETIEPEKPLAYYTLPSTSIDVNIYKNQPDLTEDNKFNIDQNEIEITIDGKKVSADLFVKSSLSTTSTPTPTSSGATISATPTATQVPTTSERVQGILFKYNNKYYIFQTPLNSSTTTSVFSSDSSLVKISQTDAAKIDELNNVSSKLSFVSANLSDIPTEKRFLPGNLKEQYKLEAYFVGKSKTDSTTSKCGDIYQLGKVENELYLECLIEVNDGYMVKYQQIPEKNQTIKTLSYLNFIYFDKNENEIKNLLKDFSDSKTIIATKEIQGQTIVIITNLSKDQATKILGNVTLNKDLEILNKQIKGN